ncbi:chain-length determining protein [Luteitalea sp. TBR-22]|uniref:GNVR domain-containing protein n=1 Tax=Luteitalea sp. TBR-22 TaxID=2802971 RepID=UPI001AF9CB1B|nr:GNVR domain-containing protein [Luteitalea sp. TBR-22]BCS36084.1 chain-length determining protein [Luteitalea sp. TBR-22]
MLPGRQLSIGALVAALRRWRWLVIVPAVIGIMGGLLASRFLPSLYRSDALIQIVPQRVPESYVSATVTEGVEDRLRAISQQVLSRTQLEKLVTDFNLFPEERGKLPMEDVIERMKARVTIEPVVVARSSTQRNTESEAFRIAFDYEEAGTAQKVVERLASFFIDTNARERGTQAEQTSAFLEAQMADARSRLEAQEQKLKDFRERNAGRLPTQAQANMQAIQNAQLGLQAAVESLARDKDRKLILERLLNEAESDETPAAPTAGTPDAVTGVPAGATPAQRLDAARTALSQMELRLSPKHPDVVRMKRLIADLEAQVESAALQRPLGGDDTAAQPALSPEDARRRDRLRVQRAELEALDRQITFKTNEERRLRGVIAAYQSRLEAVPGVESEWVALTRDYDTLQATYRELLSKSENSKMAASLEQRQIGEQFRILDPPRVPQKPFKPNRPQINAMGAVAGMGLGLALVGLMFFTDSTMRTEADVTGAVDLPVLVLLPYVTTADDLARQKRRVWVEAAAVAALLATVAALVFVLKLWRYVL